MFVIYDPTDPLLPWVGDIDTEFYSRLERILPFSTRQEAESSCDYYYCKVLSLDEARLIEALRSL